HLFESLCIDHLQRHGASKKAIISRPFCYQKSPESTAAG
ncbi:TPA: hypothetical protein OF522_003674, partial [Escherichia coli]|nr:hypothetical protein [Escherichia coli]